MAGAQSEVGPERDRKAEHLELARDEAVQEKRRYFDEYRLEHRALPEIDLASVETEVEFLGCTLTAPLLISCMTGGTGEAVRINRDLARAAEETGVALGLGSQRKALEDPSQRASFQVRDLAPSVPLLANLGAVQLNYGYGTAECRDAVEMVDADALVFHLNPLQEAIQPEGDTNFDSLLPKMSRVADELDVPVIVKEIGCGISAEQGRALAEAGIGIVDAAGHGGTSWARIEARRASDAPLGEVFGDWGIPTPVAIEGLSGVDELTVVGSGGLRTGVDMAKAIAIGADLTAMAKPFLEAAGEGPERVVEAIRRRIRELKIAMFCTGSRTIEELAEARLWRSRGR